MEILSIPEPSFPPLAWAAELTPGGPLRLRFGAAVEPDKDGLIAGAWSGPFASRAMAAAATSIGTGLRLDGSRLVALVGTATFTPVHLLETPDRRVIANSLPLALAVGGDELHRTYPFYPQDLYTFALGSDRYRRTIATRRGRLGIYYGSIEVDVAGRVRMIPPPAPPGFAEFSDYRDLLVREIAAVLANSADPARRIRYAPIVSLSAGYDSPASAVLAAAAGCREAVTFPQPVDRRDSSEDGGAAIAERLGLSVVARNTFDYRQRTDLPEMEFLAASFGGGQVYMAGSEALLAARVVISGCGGDTIWDRAFATKRRPHFPMFLGGYSATDFFLRLPALDLSVPAILSARWADIARLSRSEAMQPWSVGGRYDRPIPRRIVEEAGVPRGSFAERKRQITPVYDSASRRAPPLDGFLSPTTLAEFRRWLAAHAPIRRGAAVRHRLLVNTVGSIVWSGKFGRLLRRIGADWPPFPARLWHLRVPIRENAFVFNWAVERRVAYYREMLKRGSGSQAPVGKRGPTTAAIEEWVMAASEPMNGMAIPRQFAPAGGHAALRMSPKVTLRRLGEDQGGVVLRLGDGQLYTCNDTTVAFLEAVDGRRDLRAVIDELAGMFDAPTDQLTADLVELAGRLVDEGLIQIDDGVAG